MVRFSKWTKKLQNLKCVFRVCCSVHLQSLKQNTQLDATMNRKILFLCHTDTAQHVSGIIMPIIRSPSNCRCSLWFPYECGGGSVLSRGQLRTRPPPHSYGNQTLQRQFDGLLMMGIIMPETCWAVSVWQSNKILRLIVASSWVFYLSDWRCTEPQTQNGGKSFYK